MITYLHVRQPVLTLGFDLLLDTVERSSIARLKEREMMQEIERKGRSYLHVSLLVMGGDDICIKVNEEMISIGASVHTNQ